MLANWFLNRFKTTGARSTCQSAGQLTTDGAGKEVFYSMKPCVCIGKWPHYFLLGALDSWMFGTNNRPRVARALLLLVLALDVCSYMTGKLHYRKQVAVAYPIFWRKATRSATSRHAYYVFSQPVSITCIYYWYSCQEDFDTYPAWVRWTHVSHASLSNWFRLGRIDNPLCTYLIESVNRVFLMFSFAPHELFWSVCLNGDGQSQHVSDFYSSIKKNEKHWHQHNVNIANTFWTENADNDW